MKIAKARPGADRRPTCATTTPSFAALVGACDEFCEKVNARAHRETGRAPVDMLAEERAHLHVLPAEPHTAALGETRVVDDDQTIRFGSVRYSTPAGHRAPRCGAGWWARSWSSSPAPRRAWSRSPATELSTPGQPPDPRRPLPRTIPAATAPGRRRLRPTRRRPSEIAVLRPSAPGRARAGSVEAGRGRARARGCRDPRWPQRGRAGRAVLGTATTWSTGGPRAGAASGAGRFGDGDLAARSSTTSPHQAGAPTCELDHRRRGPLRPSPAPARPGDGLRRR